MCGVRLNRTFDKLKHQVTGSCHVLLLSSRAKSTCSLDVSDLIWLGENLSCQEICHVTCSWWITSCLPPLVLKMFCVKGYYDFDPSYCNFWLVMCLKWSIRSSWIEDGTSRSVRELEASTSSIFRRLLSVMISLSHYNRGNVSQHQCMLVLLNHVCSPS